MRKFALKSIVLAMIPAQVLALGLGDIEISSTLNQPLDAEVKLLSVRPGEAEDLLVSLASNAAFLRAGIDRPFFLTKLNFKVVTKKNGAKVIKITSKRPVVEPFLNFLLEVDWPKGRLLREYTILLDPPVIVTNNATSEKPESTSRFDEGNRRFEVEPVNSASPAQVAKADLEAPKQKAKVEKAPALPEQAQTESPAAETKLAAVTASSDSSQDNDVEQEQSREDLSRGNIERDVQDSSAEDKVIPAEQQPDKGSKFSVQEVDPDLAMQQLESLILEKTPELDGSNFTPYKIDYSVNHTNPEVQDSKKGFIPIQRKAQPQQQVKVKKDTKPRSDQYKVEKNNTLWSIARKTKANGVSIHQMMLSLLRYNPEAFIDGNINRLRKGVILRVPDKESALSIDPQTAVNLVKEQNALYQQYLARIKGVRVKTEKQQQETIEASTEKVEPEKSKDAELEILKADSSEKSEEVEESGEDNQSSQGNIEDKILLTEEELISEQQNQQDLLAEKEELDSINKKLDRLIELKVNQLSDLQERLAASETDQEAEKAIQEAEEIQQAETEVKETQEAEQIDETAVVANEVEEQQPETEKQQSAEINEQEKEEDKVQPKKLTALVENPPATEEASGGSFALLTAAVAGFLAIAGGAIWLIRKRKKAKQEENLDVSALEDAEDQTDSLEEEVAEAESLEDVQNKEELTEALSDLMEEDADEEKDFDQTSMETAEIPAMESSETAEETAEPVADVEEEEKDDTIAEADVYLAYGLYPQAEDLLTGAIKDHPDRSDYVEKLLETYFADKNIEKFQQQSESFKEMPGVANSPAWQRVVAMGKDLCPDYPLFSQEGDVVVDIADITPAKPDAPDLALDDDAEVPVDLDFGLDDSDFESTQPEVEGDNLLDFDINDAVSEEKSEDDDLMGATQIMDSTDFDLDTDLDLSSDLDVESSEEAEGTEPLQEDVNDEMDATQLLTDTDFEMDLEDADEIASIDLGTDEDESSDSDETADDDSGLEFDLGELDDLLGKDHDDQVAEEMKIDTSEVDEGRSEEEDLLAAIGEDLAEDDTVSDESGDASAIDKDLNDNVLDFDIGEAETDKVEEPIEATETSPEDVAEEEQEKSTGLDPNSTIVDLDEFADLDLGDEELEDADNESDIQQTEYNLTDLDDLLGEDEQESGSDQEQSTDAEETQKSEDTEDNFEETLVQDSEQLKANDRVDDEIDTMIELAKAYVDMGDTESAISALEEIIATGSEEQRQKAEKMLQQVKSA